jgi:hypothetical protein
MKPFHLLGPAMAALLFACGDTSSDPGISSAPPDGAATQGSAGNGGANVGAGGSTPDAATAASSPEAGDELSDSDTIDAELTEIKPHEDAHGDSAESGTGTLQIMPLGDSITYGFNGTNAGYRGPLYNLLKSSPMKVLYVGSSVEGAVTTAVSPLPSTERHNEGHSSFNINETSNNLDGLDTTEFDKYGGADRDPNGGHWFDGIASGAHARPALYPDIILMMIGTNNASDTDRTAVRNQLHALITKITTLRPNAKLVVAQITPSNRPNNVSYNADVASEVAIFRASGKQVSMVDMYTDFPADGLYTDGVHPNDKGFAFMAQQWHAGISTVVPGL